MHSSSHHVYNDRHSYQKYMLWSVWKISPNRESQKTRYSNIVMLMHRRCIMYILIVLVQIGNEIHVQK